MIQGRNYTFDAMRGAAAILVVLTHSTFLTGIALPSGFLAVDFFFILSGFVIAQSYQDRLLSGHFGKEFIKTRFVRLYPMVLFGASLGFLKEIFKTLSGDGNHIAAILVFYVSSATLIPIPINDTSLFPVNGPMWSLFFEALINIAFVSFIFKFKNHTLLIACLAGALILGLSSANMPSLNAGSHWSSFFGGAGRVIFGFCAGQLIWRVLRNRSSSKQGMLSLALMAVLIAALMINPSIVSQKIFDGIAIFAIFPAIVYIGASINPPKWAISTCKFLGEVSYPLYAIHFPLVVALGVVFKHLKLTPSLGSAVIIVCVTVAFAWLAQRFFDAPARKALTKLLNREKPFAGKAHSPHPAEPVIATPDAQITSLPHS
ncbi:acyltransferase family protein [Novosphingobium sp. 9]|uniref:acyltransferase family protein n=1 Tax=Novosphingobium sp. 9 TaxID=2025349 RepID=UPI0021B56CCC|nr:acyltransferase [Novosphingobium sp. 9]